jgi:hypothetical protein
MGQDLAKITVKDIFVRLLGDKDGKKALLEIQEKFERNIAGEDLVKEAEKIIQKYAGKDRQFAALLPVAAAAVIIFHPPDEGFVK